MPPKQVVGLSHRAVVNLTVGHPPRLGRKGQGLLDPSAPNPCFTTAGPLAPAHRCLPSL